MVSLAGGGDGEVVIFEGVLPVGKPQGELRQQAAQQKQTEHEPGSRPGGFVRARRQGQAQRDARQQGDG